MNSSSIKSLVIRDMVKLMPPLIRDSLLEDSKFCEAYELGTKVAVSFHDIDVSVERSALFNAVRKVLSGKSAVDITDLAGHQWVLSYFNEKQEQPRLVLSCDNQRLFLPGYHPNKW